MRRLLDACHVTDVLKVKGPELEKLQRLAGGRLEGVPIAGAILDIGSAGADQVLSAMPHILGLPGLLFTSQDHRPKLRLVVTAQIGSNSSIQLFI